MKKNLILITALIFGFSLKIGAEVFQVSSPNGEISSTCTVDNGIVQLNTSPSISNVTNCQKKSLLFFTLKEHFIASSGAIFCPFEGKTLPVKGKKEVYM